MRDRKPPGGARTPGLVRSSPGVVLAAWALAFAGCGARSWPVSVQPSEACRAKGRAFALKMTSPNPGITDEDALAGCSCFAEIDLAAACAESDEECALARERWRVE